MSAPARRGRSASPRITSACRSIWAEAGGGGSPGPAENSVALPLDRGGGGAYPPTRGGSAMNRAATAAALLLLAASPAAARVTGFEVTAQEPFAGGQDFGAGPYLRIAGIARGELDPADPRNAVIADLALAPRNARGKVEYAAEVVILRPADPARANGRMLYEVTNRGRKLGFDYLYDAAAGQGELNAVRSAASVGLALPLRA